MSLRELIIEYILFAFTPEQLMEKFMIAENELKEISDEDLLEVYDKTLLTEIESDNSLD